MCCNNDDDKAMNSTTTMCQTKPKIDNIIKPNLLTIQREETAVSHNRNLQRKRKANGTCWKDKLKCKAIINNQIKAAVGLTTRKTFMEPIEQNRKGATTE